MTRRHNLPFLATMLATIASNALPPQPETIHLSSRAHDAYLKQLKNNKRKRVKK